MFVVSLTVNQAIYHRGNVFYNKNVTERAIRSVRVNHEYSSVQGATQVAEYKNNKLH